MDSVNSDEKRSAKKSKLLMAVIIAVAVLSAFLWWWNYRKYITTDDANLDNTRVNIASGVMAQITSLHVTEGDTVKAGALLAELDSSMAKSRLNEAIAKAEQIKTTLFPYKDGNRAALTVALADVESAKATLGYYRITSPADGVIAKSWVSAGDMAKPGQSIFTLNKGEDIWVSVYLEETKFQNIQQEEPATFTLNAYPDMTFSGKIFYVGSNAASEFALIPPSNASGNYTKVVQRIPMKISIDGVTINGKEAALPKLIPGMSATVKIRKDK